MLRLWNAWLNIMIILVKLLGLHLVYHTVDACIFCGSECCVLSYISIVFLWDNKAVADITVCYHIEGSMKLNACILHCKPCEAYTRLITASCEAGPGTTHMWRLDFCIRSLLILDFAARCVFHNSIFGLPKCYLYIEVRKYLKLSCQGSNHHPFNNL
jgi:hypothetical protein